METSPLFKNEVTLRCKTLLRQLIFNICIEELNFLYGTSIEFCICEPPSFSAA